MPKESQNVEKRCTFSSLVSCYIHLYAMNDKSKTTLVCGIASYIKSHLWGLTSHSSCALMSYGSTSKLDLIQGAVPHTGGFPII